MFRIAGAGTVQDELGRNKFTHEDAQAQRPPTEITARWLNDVQEEIAGAVEGMGVPLDSENSNQLLSAMNATFAAKASTIHHVRDIWQIVDDMTALDALTDMPNGAEAIVTDWNGAGHGLAYYSGGQWNVQPLTVNAFDLYGTTADGHGYYWFADGWRIFDIESLETPPATEEVAGTMRAATPAEVFARSVLHIAVKPAFMSEFIDSLFVGMIADFSGTTPPAVWLPLAGQLVTRAQYPKLWNFANTGENIVDESQWSANTGKYSRGNGSTTFRLPDFRGEFRRGWDNGRGVDSGRALGSTQTDAYQSHRHSSSSSWLNLLSPGNAGGSLDGGIQGTGVNYQTMGYGSGRTANETRPRNVAALACVYAGASV
ncbi:MAG: tail fiber protein [Azoarcus sp.]|jgi:hypothetical protein|nr:tail fiber protein [Azoarcus sp.]